MGEIRYNREGLCRCMCEGQMQAIAGDGGKGSEKKGCG